jgi:hypothetical protein
MGNPYSQFTYDDDLALKDAGLIKTTTTEATVLDLGPGLFDGFLVLDVSAVEVADTNETYLICLEGSTVDGMATGSVCLAQIEMGNASAPADADTGTGRFAIPVRNEQAGTLYRYVRIYTEVAGTVGTGINFSAFLAKR